VNMNGSFEIANFPHDKRFQEEVNISACK